MVTQSEQAVLIIGAGPGGSALLDIFSKEEGIKVLGVVDSNLEAIGIQLAKELGIPVFTDVAKALHKSGDCIVFNMTRDQGLSELATQHVGAGKVIGGDEAKFFWHIILRLQTLKNDLWENQTRMKAVLHNIQEGIVSIDPLGIIEDANPAVAAVFGYTPEELIGKPIEPLIPELSGDMRNAYSKDTSKKRLGSYREVVGFHKNSRQLPLEINIARMELNDTAHFVCIVRDITDRKAAEARLTQLALYDQLTGLPNRTRFYESMAFSLSQARRIKSALALLFIDLDGFKNVNDTLGHDTGDQLLKEVGKRLQASIRGSDTAARIGGDEFMIILNNIQNNEQAVGVAEKIIASINQPMSLAGNSCQVGASIGIALYPDHAENSEDLIRAADGAMYLAKFNGKNTYRVSKNLIKR